MMIPPRVLLLAFTLLLAGSRQLPAQTYARTRLFAATAKTFHSAEISPNGRWLAFDLADNESESAIWIQPLAGGEPFPITSPGQVDLMPRWSPAGDRVFFMSTRAARGETRPQYVMSMALDSATAHPTGAPRQVTLDAVTSFRVSPDGSELAYVSDAKPEYLLRVLPAAGGSARTLDTLGYPVRNLTFTPDGKQLLYEFRQRGPAPRTVRRVALAGGSPTEVMRLDKSLAQIAPDGKHVVLWAMGNGIRDRWFEITSLSGEVVARVPAVREMNLAGFSPDGRALIVVQPDMVGPTRVMPVAGGAYRQVTEPVAYDWVGGFSADSRTVYVLTEAGSPVLRLQPVDGGQPRIIPNFGGDEKAEWHATGPGITSYQEPGAEPGVYRLLALDLDTNRRAVLSERAVDMLASWGAGPGGTQQTLGRDILFFERSRGRIELRAGGMDGRSRLLRAVPDTIRFGYFAVHGTRVAWTQGNAGGGFDLMLADGPSAPARRLLRGGLLGEPTFSPDGRWLGLVYPTPTAPGALALVDPDLTEQTQPARIMDTGALYAYWLRWLPDNSAMLVIGGGAGTHTDVIMVPLREGEKPVAITRDDPSARWGFEVSPDGRYIAYPGEIWRGSAVWRIDLNGARIVTDN